MRVVAPAFYRKSYTIGAGARFPGAVGRIGRDGDVAGALRMTATAKLYELGRPSTAQPISLQASLVLSI